MKLVCLLAGAVVGYLTARLVDECKATLADFPRSLTNSWEVPD